MAKNLKAWLSEPIFIYSFGFFYLVYRTAQYFQSFQLTTFLLFFFTYCALNYIIIRLIKKLGLYKYGLGWLLLVWVYILFIPYIVNSVNHIAVIRWLVKIRYFWIEIIIIYILLLCIKVTKQQLSEINYSLNVFFLILTCVTLVSGIITYRIEEVHRQTLEAKRRVPFNQVNKRDIVWVLLDEYASPATLRSRFHFHDSLTDSLKKKGFYTYDSLMSRSDMTISAIGSIFNLDDTIPSSNFMYAASYLKRNIWVEKLSAKGYNFVSMDFFNIAGHTNSYYVNAYPFNYADQLVDQSLIPIMLFHFMSGTDRPYDDYNQAVLKEIVDKTNEKHTTPTFYWAHLLIPHAPFYRDTDGKLNKAPVMEINQAPSTEISKQYTNYLKYGNKLILKILDQIPDWRAKTIIISGDHGMRMLTEKGDPSRRSPFAAIYYPGMDTVELKNIKYVQQIPSFLH